MQPAKHLLKPQRPLTPKRPFRAADASIDRRLAAMRRVAECASRERLLSLSHASRVPLIFASIIAAVVEVLAVNNVH